MADMKENLLSGEAPAQAIPAVLPTKQRLVLFGVVDLTEWNETTQAVVLAGGALFSALGFAYLQEKFVARSKCGASTR